VFTACFSGISFLTAALDLPDVFVCLEFVPDDSGTSNFVICLITFFKDDLPLGALLSVVIDYLPYGAFFLLLFELFTFFCASYIIYIKTI
jgi:hypothetical protein